MIEPGVAATTSVPTTVDSRPAPPLTTLRGRRLTLRPYAAGFSADEIERLYRWAGDGELIRLSSGTPIDMPLEAFREVFEAGMHHRNTATEQLFAVLGRDGMLIGRCGLFGIDAASARAELGIVIGEQGDWNRGYGREAVALLLGYAFGDLGLRAVRLHTYPDNVRARRAFEAAGFRLIRELRRFNLDRGVHVEVEMEAGREDWVGGRIVD